MSKSYRKTPIVSITCIGARSGMQKAFREKENRAKRKKIKSKIKIEDYENLPHEKEYGNEWASPRDGKQYIKSDDKKWQRK